jgi:hypothetical protein
MEEEEEEGRMRELIMRPTNKRDRKAIMVRGRKGIKIYNYSHYL